MSNLDVYYVSHFDEKQLFAHMGELGLTLDPKVLSILETHSDRLSFPNLQGTVEEEEENKEEGEEDVEEDDEELEEDNEEEEDDDDDGNDEEGS